MRRIFRETAFRLARRDLATFLDEHEEELLLVFHDELRKLDDAIPEENYFIDINMVGLGDMILKAALRAMTRFLRADIPRPEELPAVKVVTTVEEEVSEA
jgi:hypothetical protein